jgi:oligopeptide/dipeptide ABC transporter ATP-binding protein
MDLARAVHVEGLDVDFPIDGELRKVVSDVTLSLDSGRTLGIVGESGSGKSTTLRALCGLVPAPGVVSARKIELGEEELAPDGLEAVRGERVAMIFQDPGAALSPVLTVGGHLEEVLRLKRHLGRRAAREEATKLIDHVGIAKPRERLRAYPHELSGGMKQRVMIALALAAKPRVLLADEPTSALDVTTQEKILELLVSLQAETGAAMILVTHDIGVAADVCDEVNVMYAGYIVERGTFEDVLESPRHPYTRQLLAALPRVDSEKMPLPIRGQPPEPGAAAVGCPFAPRCEIVRPACAEIDMRSESSTACACPFARGGERTGAQARGAMVS